MIESVQEIIEFEFYVTVAPPATRTTFVVDMLISPAVPDFAIGEVATVQTLISHPIPLRMRDAIASEVARLLQGKIESYFDQDRELKTVANFGNDFQSLMLNWKLNPEQPDEIIAKLYNPLPPEVTLSSEIYISRDLTYPTIEKVHVRRAPDKAILYKLRPAHRSIEVIDIDGATVDNVTLQTLLSSGAFDELKPRDSLTEEWFTTALEGSQLNIDYSEYHNFVFFGSAFRRLEAFKNKLLLIENYDSIIASNSASFAAMNSSSIAAGSGSLSATGSVAYEAISSLGSQRQDILRSFDGYERFLYYEVSQSMSGSSIFSPVADDDDPSFYIEDATWPKDVDGSVLAVNASASLAWYSTVSTLAEDYDKFNVNRFANNLPEFIREDDDSSDYLKFFDLIGHMFDVVKTYIDQMTNIYDRDNVPLDKLSPDLVWGIAKSFGVELPNYYAVRNALQYTVGDESGDTPDRIFAAEMWKRFFHNQIFLLKTKGTRTAFKTLQGSYGIPETLIRVRESSTPSWFEDISGSFETFEEKTNSLEFDGSSQIHIPWSGSAQSLQVRFSANDVTSSMTLVNAGSWSIRLTTASLADYYTVQVLSGSTPIFSSSAVTDGLDNFYSLQLNSSSFYLKSADYDGDIDVDYSQVASGLSSVWYTPTTMSLGGSGFIGLVDEFRIWGELIPENIFDLGVKYPGLYSGISTTSARDYLYVRLSFNKPSNLGATPSVANESPYILHHSAPGYTAFSASGFTSETTWPYSMAVSTREVTRMSPNAGGLVFDSNKIKIAPTASFTSTPPTLYRNATNITNEEAEEQYVQSSNVVGFYVSTADAINDNIIRSIGNVDVHDYIGDPNNLYEDGYALLDDLNKLFWETYAYTFDTNVFIDTVTPVLSSLFKQAQKLIPARAKLLSGVVVEPHMLERYRYKLKPILNEDEDILNLQSDAASTEPTEVTGEILPLEATLTFDSIEDLIAELADNEGIVDASDIYTTDAEYTDVEGVVSTEDMFSFDSEYLTKEATVDAFEDTLDLEAEYLSKDTAIDVAEILDLARVWYEYKIAPESQSAVLPTYGSETIDPMGEPYSSQNLASSVYFTDPNGLIGIKEYIYVRVRENVLTDQGTWVAGTVYNRDDMVTYGNFEYYCISATFISNLTPDVDGVHWRRVGYIPVLTKSIKKAVLISGSVSLVSSSSALTPVQGYRPQHFWFYRPNWTAYNRLRYEGCQQTIDTTLDGDSPIVVTPSEGDRLRVRPEQPIIRNPFEGPILDVE